MHPRPSLEVRVVIERCFDASDEPLEVSSFDAAIEFDQRALHGGRQRVPCGDPIAKLVKQSKGESALPVSKCDF